MLNDMLGDIVAILIGNKHRSALVQLFENSSLIVGFAVLQYSLNDSAAIRVGSKDMNLTSEGFDDELDVLGRDTLNGFLNDMVAVLVFDALENICLKLLDKFSLLISEHMLKSLKCISIIFSGLKNGIPPFEQLCIHTSAWTAPLRGFSSALLIPAFEPGSRARTTSG
jgi:hypothetical protein